MRRLVMTTAISAFAGGSALAAPPYVGTWSSDRLNCHAAPDIQRETVFTVDQASLSFPDLGCEQATFRKSSTGWVVHASQCYGSDPSIEEPFARVIHIVRHGATLRFTWPGFNSGPLVRC
ncbi:hypothetical protein LB559_01865 [Mesorhizobium sp. BR1-1-3]|uniref:hypothetical protein n=1 Tax=unclassified Mesorhizobium TaxID=325217 RepID=UPI0007EC7FB7|nr:MULTISPECIES: hypothetical protein [unclassified Mesorhizobium]ARP66040.1 hypothetical protein A9K65_023855 [Mesorhizobium sp. WSM1497]MBZ9886691.1 hypothetical protein [Mesorhizobium sp. BR1-1-3]